MFMYSLFAFTHRYVDISICVYGLTFICMLWYSSWVKVATVYGATWLWRKETWVEFRAEVRLGGYIPAKQFFRLCRLPSAIPTTVGSASLWNGAAVAAAKGAAANCRGEDVFGPAQLRA